MKTKEFKEINPNEFRSLYVIAAEIKKDWNKPFYGAVPYLEAMETLNEITDNYYYDSGVSVVNYFLANASTWRGETARKIKAELKQMVEYTRMSKIWK